MEVVQIASLQHWSGSCWVCQAYSGAPDGSIQNLWVRKGYENS